MHALKLLYEITFTAVELTGIAMHNYFIAQSIFLGSLPVSGETEHTANLRQEM